MAIIFGVFFERSAPLEIDIVRLGTWKVKRMEEGRAGAGGRAEEETTAALVVALPLDFILRGE